MCALIRYGILAIVTFIVGPGLWELAVHYLAKIF